LHVSELVWECTENVSNVVNVGDVFEVNYFGLDQNMQRKSVS